MKTITTKLTLDRETVRELQGADLGQAAGGTSTILETKITCGGAGICQTHNCCTASASCG